MKRIQDPNLAELLKQLRFTPAPKRLEQLRAAEKLFCEIEPEKTYPFEFIFYRVTGFRPKGQLPHTYIGGKDLQEDLRIFILQLNKLAAQPIANQKEKIFTTPELAEYLNVSTKTIRRWYRYGLIPRRYIYEDGIKRLGFPRSRVDEFVKNNRRLVNKAGEFRHIDEKRKDEIVKRAKNISRDYSSFNGIITKISRDMGIAKETVRSAILQYENDNPEDRVTSSRFTGLTAHQYAAVYKLYKNGESVQKLMKRFNRSRSSIYRIINKGRARNLLAKKIDYIHSSEFEDTEKVKQILSKPLTGIIGKQTLRNLDSIKIPTAPRSEYLRMAESSVSLSRSCERKLFKRYNCLKYLAAENKEQIHLTGVSGRLLTRTEAHLREAEHIKDILIKSNLGLLVAIARKHFTGEVSLQELLSEGSLSLMRAVEKFDYNRNVRFSTYASWAIAKSFARRVPAKSRRIYPSDTSLKDVQRNLRTFKVGQNVVERANRNLLKTINDDLDRRERYIILNHFGLASTNRSRKKTLKQIGEDLDLSKERIRQLELIALQKLRHSLSKEEFELLTG